MQSRDTTGKIPQAQLIDVTQEIAAAEDQVRPAALRHGAGPAGVDVVLIVQIRIKRLPPGQVQTHALAADHSGHINPGVRTRYRQIGSEFVAAKHKADSAIITQRQLIVRLPTNQGRFAQQNTRSDRIRRAEFEFHGEIAGKGKGIGGDHRAA